jgi:glycosyltransferase involved in cell wall biosynthesis
VNLLFINYTFPKENNGGTERALSCIADYLCKEYKIKVFVCYFEGERGESSLYTDSIKYSNRKSLDQLETFINYYQINTVINFKKTLPSEITTLIKKRSIYLISSLRYAPNDSISKISTIMEIKKSNNLKYLLKKHFKKLYFLYVVHKSKREIIKTFDKSNKYVLTSSYYLTEIFEGLLEKDKLNKIAIIPNMLSFQHRIKVDDIDSKMNRILFVGRLEEKSKRLSIGINLWKKLISENNLEQWEFDIVGDGGDREYYENLILRNNIKKINFYGKLDPIEYYLRSKIFLMTSSAEGFPNVLLEALQFGCVPVVFNSFASLKDIIENGSNGIIVENNNYQNYYYSILTLIKNQNLLNQMALNGINSSKRFYPSIIGELWHNILKENKIHD